MSFVQFPSLLFQGLCSCSCCRPPPPRSPYQARPWKIGSWRCLATISCQQPTYLSLVLNVHFARPNKSKLVSVCSRMIGGRQQLIGMHFISHTEPKSIVYGGALRCTLYITQRARAISSIYSFQDKAKTIISQFAPVMACFTTNNHPTQMNEIVHSSYRSYLFVIKIYVPGKSLYYSVPSALQCDMRLTESNRSY